MEPYDTQTGPACARHPSEPARTICVRCGSYMCSLCDHHGTYANCESCRRFTGEDHFPFDRESFDFKAVAKLTWSRFTSQWPMLCLAIVILYAASMGMAMLRQLVILPFSFLIGEGYSPMATGSFVIVLFLGLTLVEMCIVWTISLGVFRVCLDVLMGRPASIGRQFGQFRKLGKAVLQGIAASLAVGVPLVVWSILLFAAASQGTDRAPPLFLGVLVFLAGLGPFVYYILPFFFMQAELALGKDTGPVEAIVNAALVIRDKRWIALGTMTLVGLSAFIGLLFCCVGVIPAVALAQLFASAVYLSLRTGSVVTSPMQELD